MRRWLPLILICLAVAGLAVVLSDYASKQADRLAGASNEEARPDPEPRRDPAQEMACERAQVTYDELWDQSLENPNDAEKEAALGVALGELYDACEVVG